MFFGYNPRWMIKTDPTINNFDDKQLPLLIRQLNIARSLVNKTNFLGKGIWKSVHTFRLIAP